MVREERGEVESLAKEAYSRGWKIGLLGARRALRRIRIPFPTLYDVREKFIEDRLIYRKLPASDSVRILSQIEKGFKEATAEAFRHNSKPKRSVLDGVGVRTAAMAAAIIVAATFFGMVILSGLE